MIINEIKMNLIETYLNGEHSIELLKLDTQEAKLEFFCKLFFDLKIKYETNLDDMKRLEFHHKAELKKVTSFNKNFITIFNC
jgi:hypothetical protein